MAGTWLGDHQERSFAPVSSDSTSKLFGEFTYTVLPIILITATTTLSVTATINSFIRYIRHVISITSLHTLLFPSLHCLIATTPPSCRFSGLLSQTQSAFFELFQLHVLPQTNIFMLRVICGFRDVNIIGFIIRIITVTVVILVSYVSRFVGCERTVLYRSL